MPVFLGFDTSNYKTSAAFFDTDNNIAQNKGRFLDVAHGELGLRQSDALFQHIKHLGDVMGELEFDNNSEIYAVGYSSKPRNAENSYMPCFLAGEMAAKCVAKSHNAKLYSFSHQQGHIASAVFSADKLDLLKTPFLSWHLSGGTTELLLVKPSKDNIFNTEIIGGTLDTSAGQIIDRAGVALNMDFPAGAFVDKAAQESDSKEFFIPKTKGLYFSLSGLENKFKKQIDDGAAKNDVAAFTINSVIAVIDKITTLALKEYNLPIIFSGGVSLSSQLRKKYENRENIFFSQNGLGGDNALGAAILAAISTGGIL